MMSWCKISSLTSATAKTIRGMRFPTSRAALLAQADGKVSEGWKLGYFLGRALHKKNYSSMREVMAAVEAWAEKQG